MVGRQRGIQKIQLSNLQCYTKDIITHEMMHSVGVYHEHNRLDRDDHIEVHYDCIMDRHNKSFQIQLNSVSYGVPYDHYSIMHYGPTQASHSPSDCKTITSKVSIL